MKTKLFIQNSCIVMLMTLVLALGMLGNAEALTFGKHTSSDGDLKRYFQNQEITIRVPVTLKSPERMAGFKPVPSRDEADTPVTVPAADRTNMFYDDDPDIAYVHGTTTRVNYADAHYYDQEQITIAVTGSADIKRVGSHNVPAAESTGFIMYERTHDMYDTAADHARLSGSFTLTLEPTAVGTVLITVTDSTATGDIRGGTVSPPMAFTVYVVNYRSTAVTRVLGWAGLTMGHYNTARDDTHDSPIQITVTPVTNTPITLEVVGGSGRLYVQKSYTTGAPMSKSSSVRKLETSSSVAVRTGGDSGANVYLDMGGTTNRVTLKAPGRDPVTAIFVYGYPSIEIVSGDDQPGALGGRLDDPLVVRVKDERNRGISGVPVTFDATVPASSTTTDHRLLPYPGETVYLTGTPLTTWLSGYMNDTTTGANPATGSATLNFPMPADPAVVQTDSRGEAKVYWQLGSEPAGTSQTVSATSVGETATFRVRATDDRAAKLEIVSGDNQRATKGNSLEDPLVVQVRDLSGNRIPHIIIQFRSITGTFTRTSAYEPWDGVDGRPVPDGGTAGTLDIGELPTNTPDPPSGQQVYVKTNVHGEAEITYNVGQTEIARDVIAEVRQEVILTPSNEPRYNFTIDRVVFKINPAAPAPDPTPDPDPAPDPTPRVIVESPPLPRLIIEPASIVGVPGSSREITVRAEDENRIAISVPNVAVGNLAFEQAGGSFKPGPVVVPITGKLVLPNTPARYEISAAAKGYQTATASVRVAKGTLQISVPAQGAPNKADDLRVTAVPPSGSPSEARKDIAITLSVTTGGGSFVSSTLTTNPSGYATTTFTRGSTPGADYFITATAPGYEDRSIRIQISGTPATAPTTTPTGTAGVAASIGTSAGNNQLGSLNTRLASPLVVEVVDANDNPVPNVRVQFRTTVGSGVFSPRTARTDTDGLAEVRFTPTSTGRIRIVGTVTGVPGQAVFIVQGGDPADALVKISGDTQNGTPGRALANPFIVEVQDADGEPLSGHRVTFSVTAGGGRLSETSAVSGANGRASTTLTLGSERGVNSVEASVPGADPVTFSTSIDATIRVAAANRPVMYWIASGALYRLAGAKEAKIAENVNGVAVGGGKIYWTAQPGERGGTVNSANLDGTDITELASIFATPLGISVDTEASKLYWTNTGGRIQSANLNGKSVQNVQQNLSDPTDIVVSNGFIYWTEGDNTIKRVNLSGQKRVQDVAAKLDTVGGLAVGGGKVYWTEATGASGGTVNGANLDGTQFKTLATLLSAPMGIAVDTAGSKLYWTNARGRVQSANLDGNMIRNVVEGLISPSQLAIGGANAATATPTAKTPTAKDTSAYDVNGDGKVDNTDASLVASGLDTGNAKYDVNNDGTVNFLDLLLIFDNRDADAAGAPTIVGMQLTAVQRDRIEAQIDLLIATNDRSPAAMRTLVYLQQLLATARPGKTQLLANYPNPFNPETWIPYELAADTNVKITIYNTHGVVIRTLELGHQSAGYYTGRDRAAYWDGRNAMGEQVASGIYFYQLETDEISTMRKMVILK